MGLDRWERRERKLAARRRAMKVSGQGLKKVLLPLLAKKAKAGERASNRKRRPLGSSSTGRGSYWERLRKEARPSTPDTAWRRRAPAPP